MNEQRVATPKERAEALGYFLTRKSKRKWWCKCINTETMDIRFRETDPVTQAFGNGRIEKGYREVGLDLGSTDVQHLGLLPYASLHTKEWEAEAQALNTAIKAMVGQRQKSYQQRPRRRVKRHV